MTLRRLKITDVRCVADADLALHPTRNCIYGANGAGKTTILESVYLLGRGRSFRTRQLRRLVRHGAASLAVFGEVDAGERHRRVGVAYRERRLEKRVDGDEVRGSASLVEILPLHTIDPSIHELIQGGPSERRRFLDWGVFHVEHGYLEAWRRYRRVLGQRNAALKQGARPSELSTWTVALAEAGDAVDSRRATYIARLNPVLERLGTELLGRPIKLGYEKGWANESSLEVALRAGEQRDRALANTELGPHRADLEISLGEQPLQGEASRGQQKLAASALVLAQVEVHKQTKGVSTLLVDDPAAELDGAALERLLAVLNGAGAQLVITALSPQQLPELSDSAMFHVERGEVRAL